MSEENIPIIDTSTRKVERVKKETPQGTVQLDDKYGRIINKKGEHPFVGQRYVPIFIPRDRSEPKRKTQEFKNNEQWFYFVLGQTIEVPEALAIQVNDWLRESMDAEEKATAINMDFIDM